MSISRREFLGGAGALAGTVFAGELLGGCSHSTTLETLQSPATEEIIAINEPASALAEGDRLQNQFQTQAIPDPPQSWERGTYVLKANIGFPACGLNYDDGPSPYNTERILRILEKFGVLATFYVIGVNVIAWPDIARRIRDAGHEIGNHSQFHTPYRAPELAQQIPMNQKTILDFLNLIPVSSRAPGFTKGPQILEMCRILNMYEVHSTIDSLDSRATRISSSKIVDNVVKPIHWGAIPLQHDGGGNRPTPDAQEAIIIRLLGLGYSFMTVTDLINAGTPNPGTPYYSSTSGKEDNQITDSENQEEEIELEFKEMCDYKPAEEMNRRLDDLNDKGILNKSERAEYNSINDALKELVSHSRS